MTFRVGQKVVCVVDPSASLKMRYPEAVFPSLKAVYTIRSMFPYNGKVLLRFCELNNSRSVWNGIERGFNSKYFRPIVERKTDISVFTKMLTPKGVDA